MVEVERVNSVALHRVIDDSDFTFCGTTAAGKFQISARLWLPYMPDRFDRMGNLIAQGSPFKDIAKVEVRGLPAAALQPDGTFLVEVNRHELRSLATIILALTQRQEDRFTNKHLMNWSK